MFRSSKASVWPKQVWFAVCQLEHRYSLRQILSGDTTTEQRPSLKTWSELHYTLCTFSPLLHNYFQLALYFNTLTSTAYNLCWLVGLWKYSTSSIQQTLLMTGNQKVGLGCTMSAFTLTVTHTHTHTHVQTYRHTHTHTHTHTQAYRHTHAHAHVYVYAHTRVHTRMHSHILFPSMNDS